MSLDDEPEATSDPVAPVDGGPPRLLDTSGTGDDPAAGRDTRDLLDPKNAAKPLERERRESLRLEEIRRENEALKTGGGDAPEKSSGDPAEKDSSEPPKTRSGDTEDSEEVRRRRPEWLVRPSAGTVDDPLLGCLSIVATLLDRLISNEALIAGLPMADDAMSPDLFVRAAGRAGISARLVHRPLAALDEMALPCVLLLQGKRACVLTGIGNDGRAEIILPEMGVGARSVPIAELEEVYDGYTLFARPEFKFDARSDEIAVSSPRGWFWGTLMASWRIYIEVVLAALLVNSFAVAGPLFVMNVYDRVVPNFAEETLWVLATGVVTVYGFEFVLKMLRSYFVDAAGKSADTKIAGRLFQQVLGMKMAFRPASAGGLASSLREFESLREFFTSSSLVTVVDLPFIFLFIFIISIVGGPVAVVPLVAVPIVIIVGSLMQIPLRMVVQQSYRESQQRHALLIEAIGGIETVKSTASEGRMQRNWENFVEVTARSSIKSNMLSALALNFSSAATNFVSVGVVMYGVYLINAGTLSVGGLVASTILAGRAMAPLGQIAGIMTRYHQARVSLAALDQMMHTPVERPEGRNFLQRSEIQGQIEFRNVTFSYPDQESPALDGVSFRVEAGEKVGLIGRIGSGKSSIQRLVLGLYEPDQGAVMIDGTDVRQIDPADLRRSIGSVPQDVYLFFGSVKDNIAIGAPFTDDESIRRAARITGVEEFVKRHPMGYDMPVGERGQIVSGGQRQSIAIARALLRDPPILLLDEPTSAMDNTTENRFKERLSATLEGRTVLLVTHRGSMLSLVDRLIVVDGGKIVADGPKQDVLEALRSGPVPAAWS